MYTPEEQAIIDELIRDLHIETKWYLPQVVEFLSYSKGRNRLRSRPKEIRLVNDPLAGSKWKASEDLYA